QPSIAFWPKAFIKLATLHHNVGRLVHRQRVPSSAKAWTLPRCCNIRAPSPSFSRTLCATRLVTCKLTIWRIGACHQLAWPKAQVVQVQSGTSRIRSRRLFVIRIISQRTKELGCLRETMLIVHLRYRSIAQDSVVGPCRIDQQLSCLIGLEKRKLFARSIESIL